MRERKIGNKIYCTGKALLMMAHHVILANFELVLNIRGTFSCSLVLSNFCLNLS